MPTSFEVTRGYGERRTASGDKKGNEKHGGNRPFRENEGMSEGERDRACEQGEGDSDGASVQVELKKRLYKTGILIKLWGLHDLPLES